MEGFPLHLFAQIKAKLKPVFLIVYEFVTGVMVSFETKRFQEFPDKCRGITTAMLAGW